ncbi:hypothetical protein LWC34_35430 [Kibdelosporangium philippinense]|uniref:Uncharacterized protein n=2 Tax=Kibdelosporangium philippinense TaxID=211113 RepID=A0ABS8ZKR1_9PSEU|nr:hypothetical protein [Kibdelosporangium philippinense]MCE7008077.1 hypothetical protein [Kibdelosporangium philippinense]
MTTMIPDDWSLGPCERSTGCQQANDPADSGRFLRIGGSTSPSASLEKVQSEQEVAFAKRTGYQKIRFETGNYHGYPSVEWEFVWLNTGVLRHVRATYWRASGDDYIVYASSTADKWEQTLPLYETMIAHSTP